jgi:hypothetical protein
MQRKPFILLMLVTLSVASRAAANDFGSFIEVGVWTLALSLYAVVGVVLPLALCKADAVADACEEAYEARLKLQMLGRDEIVERIDDVVATGVRERLSPVFAVATTEIEP